MGVSEVAIVPIGDGVVEVVIDRATSGNSLTPTVAGDIADALAEASATARCIILRSEGRIFCSGADLTFLESLVGETKEVIATSIYENFQRMIRAVVECPVPVLARLQGGAAGAGCDLALACDLIIASDKGWLEESWIKIGATSALAGAFHLTQTVGPHRALDLLITARRLDAFEAERLGVVHAVVSADEIDEKTRDAAKAIACREPKAVQAMKGLVRQAQRAGFEEALALGLELQSTLLARAEFAQAVASLGDQLQSKSHA